MASPPTTPSPSPSPPPPPATLHTILDLQRNTSLWYRLHVFIYDFRNFQEKVESQTRLETIVDASYLGLPYFQDEEVEYLKSTLINGETLQQIIQDVLDERLNRRLKKRVESGDFRVCAAHDLAPVFEKVVGVRGKALGSDARFQELLTTYGLKLKDGEEFAGLTNIKNFPKNKKGRKGRK